MKFGIDFEALENDEPAASVVDGLSPLALAQHNENATLLGEGPKDSVKFEWMITEWSECSQSCGPEVGYRVNYNFFFTNYFFNENHFR